VSGSSCSTSHKIACECGAGGATAARTLTHQLSPGRYFAVVRANPGTRGRFTLIRESRTITSTRILIAGSAAGRARPGESVPIAVSVAPSQSGPVTVTIERFDPVSQWQYFRTVRVRAGGGAAVVSFLPPAAGRWRASASFDGTRTASPSRTGFATLTVAGPLRE